MYLRQSTAKAITFGPFVDDTNFKDPETALTIPQSARLISKDGGAYAQSSTTGNATHQSNGFYSTTLSATDTNTVGKLRLQVLVTGALIVWEDFYVVEETVYDKMYAASADGPLQSSVAGRSFAVDGSGYATVSVNMDKTAYQLAADAVSATTIANDAITAAKIAANAIGASEFAQAAADKVWATTTRAVTNVEVVGPGAISSLSFQANAITAGAIAAGALNGKGDWNVGKTGYELSPAGIDGIWDELQSGHTTVGTFGYYLDARVSQAGGGGSGLTPLASGTAQGGTASTIQLAAASTFADNELSGNVVKITSGAGAGQSRVITAYTGSTDTATITPDWVTTPTATSVYEIVEGSTNTVAWGGLGAAIKLGATSNLPQVDAEAVSDDATAALRLADFGNQGYDSATNKVNGVKLADALTTNNDKTGYSLSAGGVDAIWDEPRAGHTTAGTFGFYLDAQVSQVGGSTPAAIADAVWDEPLNEHLIAGSSGRALASVIYYPDSTIVLNTIDGGAGSTINEIGTYDNPVNNEADALTLAGAANFRRFLLLPGSSLTLTQAYANWEFHLSPNATINFNGQNVDGCVFRGGTITGTGVAATNGIIGIGCTLDSVTAQGQFDGCSLPNAFTANGSTLNFLNCQSTGTATISGASIANLALRVTDYDGVLTIAGLANTANVLVSGKGSVALADGATTATVELAGNIRRQGALPTGVVLIEAARVTVNTIWDEPKNKHVTPDTFGDYLDAKVSAAGTGASAAEVWNYASGRTITGGAVDSLAAAERDAIADAYLDRAGAIEGFTPREADRLVLSSQAGNVTGAATTTVNIRDVSNMKNRITATVDPDGNRTVTARDAT